MANVQSPFPHTLCKIFDLNYENWSFALELTILHETSDLNGVLLPFDALWLLTSFLIFLEGNLILVVWGAWKPHSALGNLWAVVTRWEMSLF